MLSGEKGKKEGNAGDCRALGCSVTTGVER